MRSRIALLALALIAMIAAGCGGGRRLKTVPASGTVSYRGKPAVGAMVVLVPVNDDSPDAVKPRGTVAEDGTYQLTTYPQKDGKPDGAPPGEYRVSVRWTERRASAVDPDEPTPPGPAAGVRRDWLGERYSDPKKSGLVARVEGGKPIDPITLK